MIREQRRQQAMSPDLSEAQLKPIEENWQRSALHQREGAGVRGRGGYAAAAPRRSCRYGGKWARAD